MELESIITIIAAASSELTNAIQAGHSVSALGLRRSARLPWLAALQQSLECPLLLITDRNDHALMLADELALWAPKIPRWLFPEPTPLFYENAPWGLTTRRDRLLVLTSLAGYHIPGTPKPASTPVIIAPVRALMTRTLPRGEFLKAMRTIKIGQVIQPDELLRTWVSLGYEHANIVVSPGQFARRGGILDIWTPSAEQPVRIEFFGDEIDTLRRFDPASQRTIGSIERLAISPAREFITPDPQKLQALNIEITSLSEFHIPLLHPNPGNLMDYLPPHGLVVIDDLQAVRDTVQEVEEQAVGLRKDYIKDGELSDKFPIPYLTWDEIEDNLSGKHTIDLGLPGDSEVPIGSLDISTQFLPCARFAGQLKPLMEHMDKVISQGEALTIVSRQSARLQELWKEHSSQSEASAVLTFYDASLSEGFIFAPPAAKPLHLLTDGEIFGWRRPEIRQRPRPVAEAPEAPYADFEPGDWVVHVDYGIGRFNGLVQRSVDGIEREYLSVEYAEGDQLFVPVYQADRLTRYIGTDAHPPTPTRLGSPEWRTTKSRVKEAVEEVAQDLLELYARRSVVEGHPFTKDAPWQKELEASFPYVETQDQLRVIDEVKKDM